MEQSSFDEKLARVDWLAEQARWARMTLPKSGQCVCDDHTAIMDREYFDQLGEYSSTLPTGTYIGKRWKRDNNGRPHWKCSACGAMFAGWGGGIHRQHAKDSSCEGMLEHFKVEPDWFMGEYYDLNDKDKVGIRWRKIIIV